MLLQSLLRSSITKSTAKLWFTLSVGAIAASTVVMMRHHAHPSASNSNANESKSSVVQASAAVSRTDAASPKTETPLLIDCASGSGGDWTIWMVGSAFPPTIKDSTLGARSYRAVWSSRRTGALTVAKENRTLMYQAFDSVAQTFGAAQRVDRRFGNPGVTYDLSIHGDFAWSPDESKIIYAENNKLVTFDLRTGQKQVMPDKLSLDFETPAWSPGWQHNCVFFRGKRCDRSLGRGGWRIIG